MTGAQDQIALDTPLPVLRPDIEIHSGPPGADGSPTYTVHDPVNRTFDKIGWAVRVLSPCDISTGMLGRSGAC